MAKRQYGKAAKWLGGEGVPVCDYYRAPDTLQFSGSDCQLFRLCVSSSREFLNPPAPAFDIVIVVHPRSSVDQCNSFGKHIAWHYFSGKTMKQIYRSRRL